MRPAIELAQVIERFGEGFKTRYQPIGSSSTNCFSVLFGRHYPSWVVYSKEPFAGPQQVLEYLGRYTHRVAISNHRLLEITESSVRFRYRDYRDNKQKEMTLDGTEFLRRFSQLILPKGFVRIRHYGLLAPSKRSQLRELQQNVGIPVPAVKEKKDWKQICREHMNFNPDLCPHCKQGTMNIIEEFRPGRAPPLFSRFLPQTVDDVSTK